MLTLIATGSNAMLFRQRGVFTPFAESTRSAPEVPRCCGEDPDILSPRITAAVARHRRP